MCQVPNVYNSWISILVSNAIPNQLFQHKYYPIVWYFGNRKIGRASVSSQHPTLPMRGLRRRLLNSLRSVIGLHALRATRTCFHLTWWLLLPEEVSVNINWIGLVRSHSGLVGSMKISNELACLQPIGDCNGQGARKFSPRGISISWTFWKVEFREICQKIWTPVWFSWTSWARPRWI